MVIIFSPNKLVTQAVGTRCMRRTGTPPWAASLNGNLAMVLPFRLGDCVMTRGTAIARPCDDGDKDRDEQAHYEYNDRSPAMW